MKLIIPLTLILGLCLQAQPSVSNADLIIRIEALEKRMLDLENDKKRVQPSVPANSSDEKVSKQKPRIEIPSDPEKKKSFFSKLRNELKSDEIKTQKWTNKEAWEKIKRNTTEFNVRKNLGNPTEIESSINPRIEKVYYFIGDLDADGKDEKGIINMFRGRVVSFSTPF